MKESLASLNRFLSIELFEISGTTVNVATVITFFAVLLGALIVSSLVRRAIMKSFRRSGVPEEGHLGVTTRLVHYTIMVIGLGVAIHMMGINLSALFAAGAVFAVALGFAMQNITQNFASGVILLIERAIKPGDVLEVEGRRVKVVDMGIRTTTARTLDEEDIIIPNATLAQNAVINFTLRDKLYRVRVPVGVVYSSDMKLVREVLERAAKEQAWRNQSMEPVILMKAFGSSSVDWEVSVWVDEPWRMQGGRSRLHEAVWFGLKEAGITIAFPQLDVHLDPEVSEAVVALGRSERGGGAANDV
jgi:small-conductance mechanosensitive channel